MVKHQTGLHHGGRLSLYLFIIFVDFLSIGIRENKNITGVEMHNSILKKITQLADDINLILCIRFSFFWKYLDYAHLNLNSELS